MMDHELSMT